MKIVPDVIEAKPLAEYKVAVFFENGEKGIFDVKPHFNRGAVFQKLRDISYFNGVKALYGVISWYNEVDIAPSITYEETIRIY